MFSCPGCGDEFDDTHGLMVHGTRWCDEITKEGEEKVKELNGGENHPAYGYEHDEEYLEKLSAQRSGEGNPMHGKTGEDNPFYNEKHSEESRQKMSETRQQMELSGENNPNYKHGQYLPRSCEECSEEYQPTFKEQRYCSKECAADAATVVKQQQICPNCGALFTPHKEGREYCSRDCATEQRATYNSQSFYHAIRNRLSNHSWSKERYDNIATKCASCGTTEDLELHHIVPVMAGGLNENWNYLTLCESCHTSTEHYTKHLFKHFTEF